MELEEAPNGYRTTDTRKNNNFTFMYTYELFFVESVTRILDKRCATAVTLHAI